MSLLVNQSQVNSSSAFFAPASGGGGGSVGPNIICSTLIADIGIAAPLATIVDVDATSSVSTQALFVSSINGKPPGSGGSAAPDLLVSTLTVNPDANANAITFITSTISFQQPGGTTIFSGFPTSEGDDIQFFYNLDKTGTYPEVPGTLATQVAVMEPGGINNILSFFSSKDGGASIVSIDADAFKPSTLTIVSDNLVISQPEATNNATLKLTGSDDNLYELGVWDGSDGLVSRVSIGLIGGRNQVYLESNAQIPNSLWVSSIQNCREAWVSSFNVSSINGEAPGGGGAFNPNPQFSTVTMNGGLDMANNTIKMSLDGQGSMYYSSGDNNLYIQGPSTHVVAIGTSCNPAQVQVGDTSINMPTAVYMDTARASSITLLTDGQSIITESKTMILANNGSTSNVVKLEFPDVNTASLGMLGANGIDGIGIYATNGYCQMSFGGDYGHITNCSSINGHLPTITTGTVNDVTALFSTLFAANPGLSTIAL